MQRILERSSRLKYLGFLGTALQSIRQGLSWESRNVEKDTDIITEILYGGRGAGQAGGSGGEAGGSGGDDMGHLFLGDITIQNETKRGGGGGLVKKALVAGLMAIGSGGVGAGIAAYLLREAPPAAETREDRDTISVVDVDK